MSNYHSAKTLVRNYYEALDRADVSALPDILNTYCHEDLIWRGFHPYDLINGPEAVANGFWRDIKTSLTMMQRRLDMFIAGDNFIDDGATVWVSSMGHLMGLFDAPFQSIRPTGKIAMLRYAAFHRIEGDKIAETAMYFDIPHLMMQAGCNPFPPQTGAFLVQPGPMTHDALLYEDSDPAEGQKTMDAINFMVTDISRWSGGKSEPLVEELRRSWNEDMLWWGPHGIGATYTIERYAKQHSGPFREAFGERTFNGHICKIAEGHFGGFFGWPNLTLSHKGGFMGMPGTNKPADMRVIDMYRRSGDKLTENWIYIDLLHFWKEQGLDVLGRMKSLQWV